MKHGNKILIEWLCTRSFNYRALGAAMILSFLIASVGCQKSSTLNPSSSSDQTSTELKVSNDLKETNLVSDVDEYDPVFIDPNLVNAWGMAFSDEGEIWVSSADKGLSTIYGADGATLTSPVHIPFGNDPTGGAPTGVIYNPTGSFVIPADGETAEFIFATENGTIVAWNDGEGKNGITVADRSGEEAVYKGLTLASNNGAPYLYATNFKQAKVDVFDASFNYVSMPFTDPDIPSGFAPFNIKYMNGQLYVTYAKQLAPENEDDEAGPGNGYVDIYNTDGSFVKRLASQGVLNSPWGMVSQNSRGVLIGNFGDGTINAFTSNGDFISTLKKNGDPLVIEGLWALVSPGTNLPAGQRNRIYFTAGPDEESHGVFGYLSSGQ